jgi:hypothetical protein
MESYPPPDTRRQKFLDAPISLPYLPPEASKPFIADGLLPRVAVVQPHLTRETD